MSNFFFKLGMLTAYAEFNANTSINASNSASPSSVSPASNARKSTSTSPNSTKEDTNNVLPALSLGGSTVEGNKRLIGTTIKK